MDVCSNNLLKNFTSFAFKILIYFCLKGIFVRPKKYLDFWNYWGIFETWYKFGRYLLQFNFF